MAAILIVDDDPSVREVLRQFLEANGYDCAVASSASEARSEIQKHAFDVILADINMPGESGLELIRNVSQKEDHIAPLMITGLDDPLVAKKAFEVGAYDYLAKPFDLNRVLISVTNALHRRELEVNNRTYRQVLEKKVAERTAELQETMARLEKTLDGVIDTIAFTLEKRDPYTSGHQRRVARLASSIAKAMNLPGDLISGLRMAALIHDIGKIYVPSDILSKPGRLSEVEFELIKTHPQIGYEIMKKIEFPWPIAEITFQHHERIDGSGYPRGLSSSETLMEAKILGVADVVEAMVSHRPYRPAFGLDKVIEEILKSRGILYDPEVADACVEILKKDGAKFD